MNDITEIYKKASLLVGAGAGAAAADSESRGRGALYGAGLGLLGGVVGVGLGAGLGALPHMGSLGRMAKEVDTLSPEAKAAYNLLHQHGGDTHRAQQFGSHFFTGHRIDPHHWEAAQQMHNSHAPRILAAGTTTAAGSGLGYLGGAALGGVAGGRLARRDHAENMKEGSVAHIYAQAYEHSDMAKVAESYAVEHMPGHYKEALYKEAILAQIGGGLARGVAKAAKVIAPKGGTVSQAIPAFRGTAAKASNWMRNNKSLTGGLAAGGAALAAGGVAAAGVAASRRSS